MPPPKKSMPPSKKSRSQAKAKSTPQPNPSTQTSSSQPRTGQKRPATEEQVASSKRPRPSAADSSTASLSQSQTSQQPAVTPAVQVRPAPTVTTIIDSDDDQDNSAAPGSKSAHDNDKDGEEPVNSEDELGQPMIHSVIWIKSLTLMYRALADSVSRSGPVRFLGLQIRQLQPQPVARVPDMGATRPDLKRPVFCSFLQFLTSCNRFFGQIGANMPLPCQPHVCEMSWHVLQHKS